MLSSLQMQGYAEYIKTQVLADSVELAVNDGVKAAVDELNINIKVTKA